MILFNKYRVAFFKYRAVIYFWGYLSRINFLCIKITTIERNVQNIYLSTGWAAILTANYEYISPNYAFYIIFYISEDKYGKPWVRSFADSMSAAGIIRTNVLSIITLVLKWIGPKLHWPQ